MSTPYAEMMANARLSVRLHDWLSREKHAPRRKLLTEAIEAALYGDVP